jgi:hypothetical protein
MRAKEASQAARAAAHGAGHGSRIDGLYRSAEQLARTVETSARGELELDFDFAQQPPFQHQLHGSWHDSRAPRLQDLVDRCLKRLETSESQDHCHGHRGQAAGWEPHEDPKLTF